MGPGHGQQMNTPQDAEYGMASWWPAYEGERCPKKGVRVSLLTEFILASID